jgi:hypothetical protein
MFGEAFGVDPSPAQVKAPTPAPEQRARDQQIARIFGMSLEDFGHAPTTSTSTPPGDDDEIAAIKTELAANESQLAAMLRQAKSLGLDLDAKPTPPKRSSETAPEHETERARLQQVADAEAVLVRASLAERERRRVAKATKRVRKASGR